MSGVGGRGLRLRPSAGMPEKTPGASGSLQGWRLPTYSFWPTLTRRSRGLGALQASSVPTGACPQAASATPHAGKKEVLALIPCFLSSSFPSSECSLGPKPGRTASAGPDTVPALQSQHRQLFPFESGNSVFLTDSNLSLERASRGRSYFFPQSRVEREVSSREEPGQEEAQRYF